jgi:hypothetical protein
VTLLTEALDVLPPGTDPTPADATGEVTCRKKFLGYAVGATGRHKIEAPVIVSLSDDADPRRLLEPLSALWRTRGYTLDDRDLDDKRHPKLRARTPDGYEIVATAITDQPRRLHLYAVSQCLRDDF